MSKANAQCFILSMSATPSSCLSNPNLGRYEVTGTIVTFFAPSSGTLTITGGNGTSVTYSAPFSVSTNYTLPVATGYGNGYTVSAAYSADPSCDKQKTYTSPKCCEVIPASTSVSVCEYQTLTLNTTGTAGGNYFWTGPNGFSSSQQNPSLPNMSPAKAGVYQVYMVNGSCTTSPVNVNVTLKSKPSIKNIKHW